MLSVLDYHPSTSMTRSKNGAMTNVQVGLQICATEHLAGHTRIKRYWDEVHAWVGSPRFVPRPGNVSWESPEQRHHETSAGTVLGRRLSARRQDRDENVHPDAESLEEYWHGKLDRRPSASGASFCTPVILPTPSHQPRALPSRTPR